MRARTLCQEALEDHSTMWGKRREMDRKPGLILCGCSYNLGREIVSLSLCRGISGNFRAEYAPSNAKLQNIGRPISPATHHALHASLGIAEACSRGRECPCCAESPALTG